MKKTNEELKNEFDALKQERERLKQNSENVKASKFNEFVAWYNHKPHGSLDLDTPEQHGRDYGLLY